MYSQSTSQGIIPCMRNKTKEKWAQNLEAITTGIDDDDNCSESEYIE